MYTLIRLQFLNVHTNKACMVWMSMNPSHLSLSTIYTLPQLRQTLSRPFPPGFHLLSQAHHGLKERHPAFTLWCVCFFRGKKTTNTHQPVEDVCDERSSECRRAIFRIRKETQAWENTTKWRECNTLQWSDNSKNPVDIIVERIL